MFYKNAILSYINLRISSHFKYDTKSVMKFIKWFQYDQKNTLL